LGANTGSKHQLQVHSYFFGGKHRFKTPAPSTFIFFWGQTQVQNTSSKYIHIFLGANTGSKHQFQVHSYFFGGKTQVQNTSSKYIHIFLGGKHRFKTPVPSTFILFLGEKHRFKTPVPSTFIFCGGGVAKQRFKSVLSDPWF
jgi:hypothetical protein